jgi:glycosyltransferase involved in cell wall biosynthesis
VRIGIFLENLPDTGGAFQQAVSTIESLTRKRSAKHEFMVFTPFEQTRQLLLRYGIPAIRFTHRPFNLLDRWDATVLGSAILRRLRRLGLRRLGRHVDALLDDHGVDLAFLNDQGDVGWCLGDHPFIVTVWDLDHRDYPDFPETYTDRFFERRERVLRNTLTRAVAVIANSPSGARRIAELYQVDHRRIIEMPLLPSFAVRNYTRAKGSLTIDAARRKYDLADRYIFYPAGFAFHKNHLYVLEGLVELERQHGIVLQAVFCGGGDPQNQKRVERQIYSLRLTERVRFLSVVPETHIAALYEGAVALVMPSYFGPTNLPPIEAVTLGCPVICSDFPASREQMRDAALYCDLADPSSLARHLAALIQNPALFEELRAAARRLATEIAKVDYSERLAQVLDNYAYVRRRWAWPEKS